MAKANMSTLETKYEVYHEQESLTIREVRKQMYRIFSLHGCHCSYDKRSTLFQLNDTANEAYVIESGSIRTYQLTPEGKQVTFEIINPGGGLGMSEVLLNRPRMRYAETVCKTTLWKMSKEQIFNLINSNEDFSYAVIGALANCMHKYQGKVEDLATLSVPDRVIQLLIRMSKEQGKKVGNCIVIEVPITHEEIATMIGSCRQSISLILNELRDQGILTWERKRIKILRWEELMDHALVLYD